MDIISHGLWGGVAFGRKSKKEYWTAFGIGMMPDLFSFGVYQAADILGIVSGPDWTQGAPSSHEIAAFVYGLYDVTHSLVIFAAIFGLVWAIRRKPFIPLLAWGLHILIDIPTHAANFFPTPFLWPISDYTFGGIGWGNAIIFIPNLILLATCYILWGIFRKLKKK